MAVTQYLIPGTILIHSFQFGYLVKYYFMTFSKLNNSNIFDNIVSLNSVVN